LTVFTGSYGIAYMFWKLSNDAESREEKDFLLNKSAEYLFIKPPQQKRAHRVPLITFIEGNAGLNALGIIISSDAEKKAMYKAGLESLKEFVTKEFTPSNEMLYGKCGYLWALMFVKKNVPSINLDDDIENAAKILLKEGKEYNLKVPPLMYSWHNKEYLGGAHGLSGILYVLLDLPFIVSNAREEIIGTLDWLLTIKLSNGNYPSRVESKSADYVQWCHGTTAICMLFSKAYKIFNDVKYLKAAEESSDFIWEYGLLKKGFGYCHGISGNACTFLHLYSITKNTKYLQRAIKFLDFAILQIDKLRNVPDEPYCLFNGLSGLLWFCNDILHHIDSPTFPGFDM